MKFRYVILCMLIIFYIIFYTIPFSRIHGQKEILENKNGNVSKAGEIFYDSSDKLWPHRVLSTDEVNMLSKDFKGVEIDVFYNSKNQCFDIKHHGTYSNINLQKYFASTDSILSLKFWIDFKNLNSDNVNLSISLMNKICDTYKIKSNLIIESKDIILLDKFQDEGFYISYWLPDFHFLASIFNIVEIKNNLLKYKPYAISMPYSSVGFYSRKFPNYYIHCWTNNMIKDKDKDKIRDLCEIDNVKIILTDFKENFLK